MSAEIDLDISFTDESSDAVTGLLQQVGAKQVEKVPQRGMTGIEIVIVGVLIANALAGLVIKLLPLWKAGVVVDTRGKRVLVEKSAALPRGTVLVIAKDGTHHTLEKPTSDQVDGLIKTLLEAKK